MPLSARAPHSQPETTFTFQNLVDSHGVTMDSLTDRVTALALSQGMKPVVAFQHTARFVLATRAQVENEDWCQRVNASLFVRCTGAHTPAFRYKGRFADKVSFLAHF